MNEKLMKYLDSVFSPYEDERVVRDLKEELFVDLQEKLNDFKNQGYDDETAYSMTIDSIGDVKEIIESISVKTKELKQMVSNDFSKINLQNSDFKGVIVHEGIFDSSDLRGSDFNGSDLSNSSFKASDLRNVKFEDANLSGAKIAMSDLRNASLNDADLTGAKLTMCDLRTTSFQGSILKNTDFNGSDLSGVCLDNQTFTGTSFQNAGLTGTSFRNAFFRNVSFRWTDAKKAIFDGATMDKLTYAVLKGSKANLTNVTVI